MVVQATSASADVTMAEQTPAATDEQENSFADVLNEVASNPISNPANENQTTEGETTKDGSLQNKADLVAPLVIVNQSVETPAVEKTQDFSQKVKEILPATDENATNLEEEPVQRNAFKDVEVKIPDESPKPVENLNEERVVQVDKPVKEANSNGTENAVDLEQKAKPQVESKSTAQVTVSNDDKKTQNENDLPVEEPINFQQETTEYQVSSNMLDGDEKEINYESSKETKTDEKIVKDNDLKTPSFEAQQPVASPTKVTANTYVETETKVADGIVLNQVIEKVLSHLDSPSSVGNEFSFTLNPENLGKVAVKMVVEDGVLTVEFSSDNEKTQSILASNLSSIKEILKNISTDNQVNEVFEEVPQDYLEQDSQDANEQGQNQRENQNNQNNEDSQTSTSDFLSILQMLGTSKI